MNAPVAFRNLLQSWFYDNGRDLPWRHTRDPYAILVSEFMLQQTQVSTVIPYFTRWLDKFPDFSTLAAADEAHVLSLWQGLGYYSRARALHKAAQAVMIRHDGKLTPDAELLRALPGIGPYTVGAILSFAFDVPWPTVDANIARVLARLHNFQEPIDSPAGNRAIQRLAQSLLPTEGGAVHTSSLMELGALVCIPRTPRCLECPVRSHCQATQPEQLPVKKARQNLIHLHETCAWVYRPGQILLEQQRGRRWHGLWKLPAITTVSGDEPHADCEPLYASHYPFTHHRVHLRVFAAEAGMSHAAPLKWIALSEFEALPMIAPHRRAVEALLGTHREDENSVAPLH